jgi:hypothetical protein
MEGMRMITDEQMRREFEAWAVKHDCSVKRHPIGYFQHHLWGKYTHQTVELLWLAWQAALEQAQKASEVLK